jgi:flagellar biogenesis protein FliO
MKLKSAVCVGLILFIAIGSVSVGQQPTPSADAPPAKEAPDAAKNEKTRTKQEWLEQPPGDVEIPWMRVMYGIGTVLVLICIGVYVLKRFAGSSLGSGQFLDVQEVVPVDRNLRLIVIEMGDKVLLVASTEENVTKIGEYPREDVPIPDKSEGESSADFSTLLGDMLKGNR